MSDRRSLVGAIAAMTVASAAVAFPSQPDAELINLCTRYSELWSEWNRLCRHDHIEGSPEALAYDTAQTRIEAIAEPMLVQALVLPCTTLAGFQALAAALATWDQELLKQDDGTRDAGQVMTANIIGRLLALGEGA